jgi:hypothetical protein
MRKELKSLSHDDYWVYGIDERELDYTINLIKGFLGAADESIERHCAAIENGNLDKDTAGEITSDYRYYNWIEKSYLWSFALWRMQGIFEAMIISKFLPPSAPKRLIGIKAKIEAMKTAGYSLDPSDEEELLAWSNLRNLFSHLPPEQYRPIHLDEKDIQEYKALVLRICRVWNDERNQPGRSNQEEGSTKR